MSEYQNLTRFGLHYFPDTLHYRETDLNLWLPKLHALGVSWLTLIAPIDRAIPEEFIVSLIQEGIQPILHFHLPFKYPPLDVNLQILFETYARWGVEYTVLFDRPNQQGSWPTTNWVRDNLVERFLDLFLPVATLAHDTGLTPVFSPLEPGGDFWDTSFLRASLRGIIRRGRSELAESLVISAYAWTGDHHLNWGAGGPERWPSARPYQTQDGVEDQRGFRIFEWYLSEAQALIGKNPRILILAGGALSGDISDPRTGLADLDAHAQRNLTLIKLLDQPLGDMDRIPPEVIACNFWLLSSESNSPYLSNAWFQPSGKILPIVHSIREWITYESEHTRYNHGNHKSKKYFHNIGTIEHYLLVPSYEWGVADWHLEAIRPFIKKHRPTIGFSVNEALLARKVTVIADPISYPSQVIDELSSAGCVVELIDGDGTTIASKLASL